MAYAFITDIRNVRKHSNADRLQVGECFGNQVVISLETKESDLGVYFPTDTQLSEEYSTINNLLRKKDDQGNNSGGYLNPQKRNIRALKLRKEISDGLFMPITSLESFTNINKLKIGDCVDVIDGNLIAQKYVPIQKKKQQNNNSQNSKKKKLEDKISYPLFSEHKDTKQYAYNKHVFKEGDLITLSLKMHGTSARTSISKKITIVKGTLLNKLLIKLKLKQKKIELYETVSGSRRVVLKSFEGGYYKNNDFRKKYHDYFDGKLMKGETIYYEVVGYTYEDSPIMSRCDNKKTQDKEFIKKYGKETVFSYGCLNGDNDIYAYRMTMTNDDGDVVEYPTWLIKQRCEQMNVKIVPIFESFFFTTLEDLESKVNEYAKGGDPIGKTHIREGVIIRVENNISFQVYKHKSFNFKVLEGIIKDAGIVDIEEEESLK